ncbi:uncharacterized protein LOC128093290 [Culex pipiens pallens]|uniref:uncharacterized protein LOC120412862 n=1 Tax=Culex pipiens pallens TaxID=42434 RepID=UPI001953C899|nr:uncharacterized protein LOC120412862 [Culex pipiens pallens]XP_052565501.1 uncharacterized protein LOC128093290 [Culex pipiens pallens]
MSFKRSREDLTTSDPEEEPVQSLDELFSRMKTMFEKTNARIENCKSDLQSEFAVLREDMQQFKTECSNNVNKLSADLSKTRDNVSLNYERILVCGKLNDLLLSGVPYQSSENISNYVRSVSLALGYSDQDRPLIYTKRLARLPIADGTAPPLLLQFTFRAARDEFYRRYLSSRNLSLSHLGFSVNKRIYLNENLTELARSIKGSALKMKKDGKLHSVFTKDGFVQVKDRAEDEARPVHSVEQLANKPFP